MKNRLVLETFFTLVTMVMLQLSALGQANTALSNLAATTAVNSNLLPQTNNTKNIGSTANSWMNCYLDGIVFLDDARFISNFGTGNSLIGENAGLNLTTGTYNTFTGNNSGRSTTTGYSNTFFGQDAGYTNSTGILNTFVGKSAGYLNNSSYCTGVGASALLNNIGGSNSALGFNAMVSNTSGNINCAFGVDAMNKNTTGYRNVAMGAYALYSNTIGINNVAFGTHAMYTLSDGNANTAIGNSALYALQSGFANTSLGSVSLHNCVFGDYNTALGVSALINSDGNFNTGVGAYSLANDETGTGVTALGYSADVSSIGLSNATVIGYSAVVDASNKVRIGNSSVTSNGGQVSWTAYSDGRIKSAIQENVPGLQFINALRPVTYHFDLNKQNELLGLKDTAQWEGKHDIEKIQWTGFIAQEVEAAANSIGYDFSGVDKSGEIMGLRYAEFVVPLVKAVQELSAENTALEERIANLEALIYNNGAVFRSDIQNQPEKLVNNEFMLGQNTPNPATGKTSITYRIPATTTNANFILNTQNGVEVFNQFITSGTGTIELDTNALGSGNYFYSIYVNGQIMCSKQMTIIK